MAACVRPCPRSVARRRAEALANAIAMLEDEFGLIGEVILNGERLPIEVPLTECNYGWPDDVLANDVTLEPWEIMMLLHRLHDRYTDEVLGPSEAA